ncbi:MAG TPA: bifunctional adenosylcobinamide kinase/adenosylcobinamide-phosphate guanylyltransferase [Methylomirabilota bacterium]|jgi:adenosylcobinamide kinase/adenosylcobinamide-phosphate guanylyltransferase
MSRQPVLHQSDLILGGVRSGKSRQAILLATASPSGQRAGFLATARADDRDMARRIARHQADRPTGWCTVEEPYEIAEACRRLTDRVDLIVLDCLTLWVSNLLLRGDLPDDVLAATDALAKLVSERRVSIIIVSNEVGSGVHPPTEIGVRFQDTLGGVNQRVAAAADRVTLMVAGVPMLIKDSAPRIPADARAPEAP